ncbi:sulfur carrier protein ThiS [Neogemmobacter tilapiae]|uniref:sulfur carrier protein ThiS n=1 Tax=Neogemmobacter tilapiae TaxID=875041 RepID=UPI00357097D3
MPPTTVAIALANLGFPTKGIATALNGHFLAAHARDRLLAEGDRLEVLSPMQGG